MTKEKSTAPSGVEGFRPYIPAETTMAELTLKAVLVGIVLSIILGAANTYLGLKAGMTVAATFPAAVISMAVLRLFRGSILEENIARTTGAVGEALAAGAIFTIPALILTGVWDDFKYIESTVIMVIGGILGVLLIIILRRTLVEDASLPFPESVACAEIVKTGQKGGTGAIYVFGTMVLGGLIQLLTSSQGLGIIKPYVKYFFGLGKSAVTFTKEKLTLGEIPYRGNMLVETPTASPALTGVGYIIGPRLASITFAGGVFGWLFLMPLVLFFGGDALSSLVAEGVKDKSWVDIASAGYNSLVKPVAVGAMLVGAFFTLFRMRRNLISGVQRAVRDLSGSKEAKEIETVSRVDKDLSFGLVFIGIVIAVVAMVFLYTGFSGGVVRGIVLAIVMAFAGLLFAAVAGYLVGIIGSSSNPISGLTLTTLLIAAVIMALMGVTGNEGIAGVLGVAAVVCCVAGVAGDMIQDWKVGHILGGTPSRMEFGGMVGVIAAALVLAPTMKLLHQSVIIGSEELPAPQAGLMALVSTGIVGGKMAWPLVLAGMAFAVALILLQFPSPMLVAVGMYLPFHSTACIFFGGVVKFVVDRTARKRRPTKKGKEILENVGLLLASGLIAGEALMGIITAFLDNTGVKLDTGLGISWLALVIFAILALLLIAIPYRNLINSGEIGAEKEE